MVDRTNELWLDTTMVINHSIKIGHSQAASTNRPYFFNNIIICKQFVASANLLDWALAADAYAENRKSLRRAVERDASGSIFHCHRANY